MMPDDEDPRPSRQSGTKDLLDAYKSKAGFDTLFPEGPRKKNLIPFVARWLGPIPDAYDRIAAGVQLEMSNVLRDKALAILNRKPDGAKFDWSNVGKHPIIKELEELTISMGGGKGRKEGVEMSKGNPPVQIKSRWSWRRNDGR